MDMRTLLMLAGGSGAGAPEMSYGETGMLGVQPPFAFEPNPPAPTPAMPAPPPAMPAPVPGLPPTGMPQTLADFLDLRKRTMGAAAEQPMAPQARDLGILMAGLGMMQPWQKGKQTAAGALGTAIAGGVGAAQKEDLQRRTQGAEDFRTIMEGMKTVGGERRAERADVRAEKALGLTEAEGGRAERKLRIEERLGNEKIKALGQEYEKDKLELEVLQNKKKAGLTSPEELKRLHDLAVQVQEGKKALDAAHAEYYQEYKKRPSSAQAEYTETLKKLHKEMNPTATPEEVARAVWNVVNSGKSDTLKAAIAIYDSLDATPADKAAALKIMREAMGRLGTGKATGVGVEDEEGKPKTGAGRIPFGAIGPGTGAQ